jgi:hypothetical protein
MMMTSPSDAEVIGRSLGKPEAFGLIYDRHAPTLLRFLGRRTGAKIAEEVLGELFRIAFERRKTFDTSRASALPWLYGIGSKLPERRQQKVPGRFGHEERHDAGGIPEPHRLSRRSSSRAWTTLAPGWGAGPERVERKWSPGTSQKPCPLEAREPIIGVRCGLHALETRDGLIPVQDEHGLPGPYLLDVGAQAILELRNRDPFHMAMMVMWKRPCKLLADDRQHPAEVGPGSGENEKRLTAHPSA